MKYLKVLLSISVILCLWACGGGNKSTSGSGTTGTTPIALFTTAPATVTISQGGAANTFSIGGGTAPYAVSSSNVSVAAVSLRTSGSNSVSDGFSIVPGNLGTAQVLVVDSTGTKVSVDVTVTGPAVTTPADLYVSAPSTVNVSVGALPANTYTYVIGGGSPPYTAVSSNLNVVTVAPVQSGSPTYLTMVGKTVGSAEVDVFDNAHAKVAITVNVISANTAPALTVSPAAASGNLGDTLTFIVTGGTPGYTLVTANPAIAKVSPATLATSGGTVTAQLNNVGSTLVTITDSVGVTASFTLTVGTASPSLRLSPSAFIVGEDNTGPIVLPIYGGTPPYSVLSGDLVRASVGTQINANGSWSLVTNVGTQTTRCFTPLTPFGTYDIVLTVIDALGATASSTMTLQDNGNIGGNGLIVPCS